jgi:hypothetical protein
LIWRRTSITTASAGAAGAEAETGTAGAGVCFAGGGFEAASVAIGLLDELAAAEGAAEAAATGVACFAFRSTYPS